MIACISRKSAGSRLWPHRELSGTVKTVTVSRSATGKYDAAVVTNDGQTAPETIRYVTRIDLGLTDAIMTRNGAKTPIRTFCIGP